MSAPATDYRVAVLGPGGVGGFLAAMLARGGSSVLVLAGDETARAIARSGLRLESVRYGTFEATPRTATGLEHPVDACLITVKAMQLHEALDRVPAGKLGHGLVIPFLNGLEHVELLRDVYPPDRVVPATIRIETARVAPGVVRHTSPFAGVDIAYTPGNREAVEEFAARLRDTGVDVRLREDEVAMLWEKFALLAPMALLTTHARANAGVVRAKRRQDVLALIAEVAAVARADRVAIDEAGVLRLFDAVPESMETSMQRDQAAGRPLELDALGGALLRRAARGGVEVPLTRRLVEDLQARASAARR